MIGQIEETLGNIFALCDLNNTGQLNKRELIQLCHYDQTVSNFFGLPRQTDLSDDIRAIFKAIDIDGDSPITWSDFKEWYDVSRLPTSHASLRRGDLRLTDPVRSENALDENEKQLRSIFEYCDINDDGSLSKLELVRLCCWHRGAAGLLRLPAQREQRGTSNRIEYYFQKMDRDEDGQISWPVFQKWYARRCVDVMLTSERGHSSHISQENILGQMKQIFQQCEVDDRGNAHLKQLFQLCGSPEVVRFFRGLGKGDGADDFYQLMMQKLKYRMSKGDHWISWGDFRTETTQEARRQQEPSASPPPLVRKPLVKHDGSPSPTQETGIAYSRRCLEKVFQYVDVSNELVIDRYHLLMELVLLCDVVVEVARLIGMTQIDGKSKRREKIEMFLNPSGRDSPAKIKWDEFQAAIELRIRASGSNISGDAAGPDMRLQGSKLKESHNLSESMAQPPSAAVVPSQKAAEPKSAPTHKTVETKSGITLPSTTASPTQLKHEPKGGKVGHEVVNPALQRAKLMDIFRYCDSDQDGKIGVEDLLNACRDESWIASAFGLPKYDNVDEARASNWTKRARYVFKHLEQESKLNWSAFQDFYKLHIGSIGGRLDGKTQQASREASASVSPSHAKLGRVDNHPNKPMIQTGATEIAPSRGKVMDIFMRVDIEGNSSVDIERVQELCLRDPRVAVTFGFPWYSQSVDSRTETLIDRCFQRFACQRRDQVTWDEFVQFQTDAPGIYRDLEEEMHRLEVLLEGQRYRQRYATMDSMLWTESRLSRLVDICQQDKQRCFECDLKICNTECFVQAVCQLLKTIFYARKSALDGPTILGALLTVLKDVATLRPELSELLSLLRTVPNLPNTVALQMIFASEDSRRIDHRRGAYLQEMFFLDPDADAVKDGEEVHSMATDAMIASTTGVQSLNEEAVVIPEDEHLKDLAANPGLGQGKATHTFEPGEIGIFCDDGGTVQEVVEDGPAYTKGIKQGNLILNIGNEPYSKDALLRAQESGVSYEVTFQVGEPQVVSGPDVDMEDTHLSAGESGKSTVEEVDGKINADMPPLRAKKSIIPKKAAGNSAGQGGAKKSIMAPAGLHPDLASTSGAKSKKSIMPNSVNAPAAASSTSGTKSKKSIMPVPGNSKAPPKASKSSIFAPPGGTPKKAPSPGPAKKSVIATPKKK